VAVTPGIQGRDTTKSELEDSLIAKAGIDYEIEQADPRGVPINRNADKKLKSSLKSSFQKAQEYIETTKYGTAAKDDDSEEEEARNPDLVG